MGVLTGPWSVHCPHWSPLNIWSLHAQNALIRLMEEWRVLSPGTCSLHAQNAFCGLIESGSGRPHCTRRMCSVGACLCTSVSVYTCTLQGHQIVML